MKRDTRRQPHQPTLFDLSGPLAILNKPVETMWLDALEKAKANRTVFAQPRVKSEEVLPEWRRQLAVFGGEDDVTRFVRNACARLNTPLDPLRNTAFTLLPHHLPQSLRERLAQKHITKPLTLDFHYPPLPTAQFVHRSHPLVALLADHRRVREERPATWATTACGPVFPLMSLESQSCCRMACK